MEALVGLREVPPSGRAGTSPERLVLRSGSRTFFVRPSEIDWVEAESNYVRVHGAFGAHLVRGTLAELAESLRDAGLCRIHRSILVNLAAIRELRRSRRSGWTIVLRDGTVLGVTPPHREALMERLQ